MLSCIPPTKEAIEKMNRSTYCGASSNYKPVKVITEDAVQTKTKNGHKVMLYQQPYSVLQAYQKDDVVEKDGHIYRSNVNDNVWAPDLIESRMTELWSEITRLKTEQSIHSQLIETVNKCHLPPIHRYDWLEME